MELKFLKTSLAGLILSATCMSNVVNAALITETWQGTVTSTSDANIHNLNDVLSWTVTYEDTATIMNVYLDGADGIAGTADDTLSRTETCPTGSSCSAYSSLANASIGLDDILLPIYAKLSAQSVDTHDRWLDNYSRRFTRTNGQANAHKRNDDYGFGATWEVGRSGFAAIEVYTSSSSKEYVHMGSLSFTSVITTGTGGTGGTGSGTTALPEPSTLAIFALGIIGLASRKYMK
jgi:hypothetical protein